MLIETENEIAKLPSGRILGIDYGQKRVGLALSDPSQFLASTLKTINSKSTNVIQTIASIAHEESVVAIVIGLPYNMDGSIGRKGEDVKHFISALCEKVDIPVIQWDERWSTVSAHKELVGLGKSPSKNRHRVDQIAAAIILQSFLDRLKRIRQEQSLDGVPHEV